MAYRWDPFTTLSRLDRDFDQLIRLAWPEARAHAARAVAGYVPPIEMIKDGSDVVVRVELPGVDIEKDVEVEVDRGRLVIHGERRDSRDEQTSGVLVRELRYGSFRREFALPESVTSEHVDASYDAGMLEIRVHPVDKQVSGTTRIPVSARPAHEPSPALSGEASEEPSES